MRLRKALPMPEGRQLSCNPNGNNPGDVWIFPKVKNNHVEKDHPPLSVPCGTGRALILSMTEPGDWVLDPYMGLGLAVIAAVKHDRHRFGCDIVKEYFEIARCRLHHLRERNTTHSSNGPTRI